MSSSGKKKFHLAKHPLVVDLGCGCRRTKLSSLFSSSASSSSQVKAKLKPLPHSVVPKHHHPLSSYYPFSPSTNTTGATSPSWATSRRPSSTSTATTSFYGEDASSPSNHVAWGAAGTRVRAPKPHEGKAKRRGGKAAGPVGESVAVVKESSDPYVDFRQSMLQMILEKEIYAWDDLCELVNRFLALNAPHHHDIIVGAFAEIWSDIFSSSSSSTAAPPSSSHAGVHRRHGRTGRGHHGGARRRHVPRE